MRGKHSWSRRDAALRFSGILVILCLSLIALAATGHAPARKEIHWKEITQCLGTAASRGALDAAKGRAKTEPHRFTSTTEGYLRHLGAAPSH